MRYHLTPATIILGDFNTPLTAVDRSSRQKINKEILALSDKLDQLALIDYIENILSHSS